MDHFLSDAKRLVQRLQHHDNAVDILIGETTNLQNKLIAMRQYRDEVNKMNQAANHRPRSTLILGSQLENQRIQNLEHENRELSISLAEHQSALELIMNKYREQVLVMMKANGTDLALNFSGSQPSEAELKLSEQITEMALVMRHSAAIDESVAAKEIETIRSLQVENDNLRQLLLISGQKLKSVDRRPDEIPLLNDNLNSNGVMETVSNKDSGIYDEDISPNVDIFKKGKKTFPFVSKHADNLENLFKPMSNNIKSERGPDENFEAEEDISPNINVFKKNKRRPPLTSKHAKNLENFFKPPSESLIPTGKDENDGKGEKSSDGEEDEDVEQFQFYTVEALVQPKDDSLPDYSMMNGDLRGDFETPDSHSTPSSIHEDYVNNEFKDILSKSNNTGDPKRQDDEDDALQFLDDILDDNDNDDGDDEDLEMQDDRQDDVLQFLDDVLEDDFVIDDEENGDDAHRKGPVFDNNEMDEDSNNKEDVKRISDNIIRSEDIDVTIQSDTESEITVTDEDDALAMFDSVLDEEIIDDDNDDDN